MRILMWFTLGFGGAAAWGAYGAGRLWPVGVIAGAVLAGVLLLFGRRVRWPRMVAALCVGLALGLLWFRGFENARLDRARAMDGETAKAEIRISDYSWDTNYGSALDGQTELDGKVYRVRVYLRETEALEPGDRISGFFRFQVTVGPENGTFHQGKGIFLLAYQSGALTRLEPDARKFSDYPAIWRHSMKDAISAAFPADTAGFARALLLGDSSRLDYETNTAFKVSGIRHIVAVSGLHISILFGAIALFSGRRRWPMAIIGIPVLTIFAAVVGFTPSVTRACIMEMLMLMASLVNREYDQPTALASAALVMLAVNPLIITSVSFQMSVGCVAGIFLFAPPVHRWILSDRCLGNGKGRNLTARLKRFLARSVSVTLSSMVITAPLCAIHFGTVSLVSPLTNLLVMPILSLAFYGTALACLTGMFWLPGARILAWVTAWALRYVRMIAKVLSRLPLSAVYTQSIYIVLWLVFVYVLLAVFLSIRRKKPAVFAGCAALGLCLALTASWVEPLTDQCRMTVLDVGQGQSILLQSQGKTYLVDCGGDYGADAADLAAETLLSQGVSRLDGLIVTHFDRDHSGGAASLLTRIRTDAVFLPDGEDEDGVGAKIAAGQNAVPVHGDLTLESGAFSLTIYRPVTNSGNDSSLAVLFQAGDCAILITGDRTDFGERRLIAAGVPDVDVLVVGHHGSGTSTCQEFLEAVSPEIAVISVSAGNPYGHPKAEVLERLTRAGCEIYRTDQNGTIVFRR